MHHPMILGLFSCRFLGLSIRTQTKKKTHQVWLDSQMSDQRKILL